MPPFVYLEVTRFGHCYSYRSPERAVRRGDWHSTFYVVNTKSGETKRLTLDRSTRPYRLIPREAKEDE